MRQLGGAGPRRRRVDLADGTPLLVRRASVGVIHRDTLTLEQEFRVLEAAVAAGVAAPRPVQYLGDVDGHEAFAMERVQRRDDRPPHRAQPAREAAGAASRAARADPRHRAARLLPEAMPYRHPLLRRASTPSASRIRRSNTGSPVRERLPTPAEITFCHGDFRIGNFAVDAAARLRPRLGVRARVTPSGTSPGRSCARGASAPTAGGSGSGGGRALPRALQRADRPCGHRHRASTSGRCSGTSSGPSAVSRSAAGT